MHYHCTIMGASAVRRLSYGASNTLDGGIPGEPLKSGEFFDSPPPASPVVAPLALSDPSPPTKL